MYKAPNFGSFFAVQVFDGYVWVVRASCQTVDAARAEAHRRMRRGERRENIRIRAFGAE